MHTQLVDEQVKLLAAEKLPEDVSGNFVPFERFQFDSKYEEYVRIITNPNGRGNAAYSMQHEKAMLPQDTLVRVWGWFHGSAGFSAMFKWASGRQDAYVIPDVPEASADAIAKQEALITRFKQEKAYVIH